MAIANMITLTDAAAARVKTLMDKSEEPVLGLRVGVNTRGCSGMSYVVEYAKEQRKLEDVVEDKGVKIFIDPMAVMFLLGSEMDYVEDKFQSGFVFNNPNEKGRCGCGESFHV
ncbi:iron-sulfur cluster assembly accessory protein [Pelagibius sp.]|uniref:HesB/IscA family protein n=1 Tax=Pelagibius sp. TaxID=1931238 RepID=UPI00262DBB13|nr:iron-sulfur cluster assembly accessory protein [Pelagibius sp.]